MSAYTRCPMCGEEEGMDVDTGYCDECKKSVGGTMEQAEALLKECEEMLEEYADLGLLETKEVLLMNRLSSFLHDGTKGEGK